MFQDILNFGVRKLNELLDPKRSPKIAKLLKFIGLDVKPISEFTFGDDASKATAEFINTNIGSGKLDAEGNLIAKLEDKTPVTGQGTPAVNVASQVTSNNTENKNFQKKQQKGKLAEQAGDSSP